MSGRRLKIFLMRKGFRCRFGAKDYYGRIFCLHGGFCTPLNCKRIKLKVCSVTLRVFQDLNTQWEESVWNSGGRGSARSVGGN